MRRLLLETEQEELLVELVEASRNVPRDRRQPFIANETIGSTLAHVIHEGLTRGAGQAYMGDLDALADQGLVRFQVRAVGEAIFDVTPLGFKYYERLKGSREAPIEAVEEDPVKYLSSMTFQKSQPEAFRKWSRAAELLHGAESQEQFTTVGHLCREAMQEFAAGLTKQIGLPSDKQKSRTVDRIRTALHRFREQSGQSVAAFSDALLGYWGTVSDLVQRQEHGAEREGASLVFEDARRLVFHTCIVMYEIDRVAKRSR